MDRSSTNNKQQIIATLSVFILIAVIVGGFVLTKKGDGTDNVARMSQRDTKPTATTTNKDTVAKPSTTTYKDGTYEAVGGYNSPGGAEEITVSVTLKGGKITNSTVEKGANDGQAQEYQGDFISAFKELVVGKSINDLKLSRVAGASLTTGGFNNAITKIKSEAKS